jgi:ribonuclease R
VAKRKKAKSAQRDPHYAREAEKYADPIPSREFIMDSIKAQVCPVSFRELMDVLQVAPERQQVVSRRVNAMLRDGQLVRSRRGYCVVGTQDLVKGKIIGHPDGFGFMQPDEGGEDLFLAPQEMRKVWHGDHVLAQVSGVDNRGRYEGSIVDVLERAFDRVVGRLHIEKGVVFLVPDNKRLTQQVLIQPDQLNGGKTGQVVVAEIVEHPLAWRQAIGRVVEILGKPTAPGMETEVAMRSYGIPTEWPQAVLDEVAALADEVPEKAKQGRVDLRDLPLVTIDGEDARDFDDAVYCEALPKGFRLYVAIADVSSYVQPGSALDKEAYGRGTSVYFPDRVVPMLPEKLSNGLCSLNPKVDRLCMVAELSFKPDGEMYRSRFYPAVMNSHARLTYDQVGAMLQGDDGALCEQYADLLPHLHQLYALYQALHAARQGRGAIDFDTTETVFRFDENGKLAEVVPLHRHDAHRIIEECMLAANVAAARLLLRKKIPALYRIHESPSVDKLTDLTQFLQEQGLRLNGGLEPTAKDYADLLNSIQQRADMHVIQVVLLRSMMQAVYSAKNIGHFGLAFPAYAHFTSPIRRYPDLLVHRAIKHVITEAGMDSFTYSAEQMAGMGEHCSSTERRADDASRDAAEALKCEYMSHRVGQVFPGVISGVNAFGLFVELDEIFISGLLHVTALDNDYFNFDPIHHRLTGERSGQTYRLGDPIVVRVAAVNVEDRKIDFVLDQPASSPKKRSKKKSAKRRGKKRKQ